MHSIGSGVRRCSIEDMVRGSGDGCSGYQALPRSMPSAADEPGSHYRRSRDTLPLAEETYRLATEHGLTTLALTIEPIVDFVRAQSD